MQTVYLKNVFLVCLALAASKVVAVFIIFFSQGSQIAAEKARPTLSNIDIVVAPLIESFLLVAFVKVAIIFGTRTVLLLIFVFIISILLHLSFGIVGAFFIGLFFLTQAHLVIQSSHGEPGLLFVISLLYGTHVLFNLIGNYLSFLISYVLIETFPQM